MQEKKRDFYVQTVDKHPIKATLYHMGEASDFSLTVVVSAPGTSEQLYSEFAKYSSKNMDTLTFDYRGIGQSKLKDFRDFDANIYDWGRKDLQAILKWAERRYQKIFVIGHGLAGHIFPLAKNSDKVTAAYFVSAPLPYRGYRKGFSLLKSFSIWKVFVPFFAKTKGYVPGWVLGCQLRLPRGVAYQWAEWTRDKDYVFKDDPSVAHDFSRLRIPIHFVGLADAEVLAPADAVQALMRRYKNSKTSYQYIRPKDMDLNEIGHFGFWQKDRQRLWSMPIMYFAQYAKGFH